MTWLRNRLHFKRAEKKLKANFKADFWTNGLQSKQRYNGWKRRFNREIGCWWHLLNIGDRIAYVKRYHTDAKNGRNRHQHLKTHFVAIILKSMYRKKNNFNLVNKHKSASFWKPSKTCSDIRNCQLQPTKIKVACDMQ